MRTLTLDEAQRTLNAIAQLALRGEQIFIRIEGSPELLSLQSVPVELPENYLAACYGREEIAARLTLQLKERGQPCPRVPADAKRTRGHGCPRS